MNNYVGGWGCRKEELYVRLTGQAGERNLSSMKGTKQRGQSGKREGLLLEDTPFGCKENKRETE
jgi:hypothetical protein